MKPIVITVLQEEIDNAVQRDSHRCMIKDAVQRANPTMQWITVDAQTIRFTNRTTGLRHIYLTPPRAAAALIAFDQGKKLKPFKFTMCQGYTRRMRTLQGQVLRSKKKSRAGAKKFVRMQQFREFGLRQMVA